MQLSIENLHYRLGKQTILDNINLTLNGAQVVTLLGPNGAGKSTLLKVLAASLYCQSGKVLLDDLDAENNRLHYLPKIGYMPEKAVGIAELTVLEQLKLQANLKKITEEDETIQGVIKTCQLDSVVNKRTKHLSLGYTQRLNLAQALLNKPQVLIMDEPLNGLDPHLIIEFREIISQLKKETLIIMSTHYLAEAQLISDRVLIMQEGQLLDNIEMHKDYDLEQIYKKHTVAVT